MSSQIPAQLGGSLDVNKPLAMTEGISTTKSIKSSGTEGVGYATGAGSSVTQATSKSTAVTLNKICGTITMNNAALNAGVEVAFTVNNSLVAATDVVVVNIASGGASASYLLTIGAVAAGSFAVTVSNASAGNLSEALVLNFAVIKAVAL